MPQPEAKQTRRERLDALRVELEAVIFRPAPVDDEAPAALRPTDLAALSKEYRAVLTEIDAVPTKEGSPADEIAERRARRRAAAPRTARAEGSS